MFRKYLKKTQLQFWKRLQEIDSVSARDYLAAQPRNWRRLQGALFIIWILAEIFGISDQVLRILFLINLYVTSTHFFRLRLHWPTIRRCLDWEKIDQLLEEERNA